MKEVFFSIIVPVYNKGAYISRTIDSILKQDYPFFELILVNDGSKDNSVECIKSFQDPRIILINKENGGVSSARNMGINSSNGEWIVFFDADDIMYYNALSHYKELIDKYPNYFVFATGCDLDIREYPTSNFEYVIHDLDMADAKSLAKYTLSVLNSDCICIYRDCFNKVGLFNLNYTHGEDLDMWIRLSKFYPILKSEKVTAMYITDYPDNSAHNPIKKESPRSMLNKKRSDLSSVSKKAYHGAKVFFHVRENFNRVLPNLYLCFKYFDCLLIFIFLLFKYRFFGYSICK